MHQPLSRRIVFAFLLALAACKIGVGGTTGPTGSSVATVVVSPSAATVGPGEVIQLTATSYNASGAVLPGQPVSWSSDNTSAATVMGAGSSAATVTGVGAGTATITARADTKTGSTTITTAQVAFASVTTGVGFTCGLTTVGAAWCWGNDEAGELGDGTVDTLPRTTPTLVAGGHTFTALAAGGASHVCGLVAGGTMFCWGDNSLGQLGIGSVDLVPHPLPVAVTGAHSFIALVTNGPYTCAVDNGGAAWCWGDGTYGELGSTSTQSGTPTAVGGGLIFVGIGGGNFHVCAATSTGVAYCWGRNNAGQLGIGSTDSLRHTAPAAVLGGIAFTVGSGGANYSCGLSGTNGYCWGGNFAGRLGTGVAGRDSVPTPITGGIAWRTISASNQTCGVSTTNVGYCWGNNSAGELGIGAADTLAHVAPVAVAGGLSFADIRANRTLDTCGITTTGRIYCWGDNTYGQLGNGTFAAATVPVKVFGQP